MSDINLTAINETITEYSSIINGDTITILSVNSNTHNTPPVLSDFWFEMFWNDHYEFDETDIDNATTGLQPGETVELIQITSLPVRGTLTHNGAPISINHIVPYNDFNSVTYTPHPNMYGMPHDSFTIRVADSGGNPNTWSNEATITAYVHANTPPQVSDSNICIRTDTEHQFNRSDFLQNYVDLQNNPPVKIKILSLPTNSLMLSGNPCNVGDEILLSDIDNGDLKYYPQQNQVGRPYDAFQFAVTDNVSSMYSNAAFVKISFNNKPGVIDKSITVYENTVYEFTYQFWYSVFNDIDGDLPHIVVIESLPSRGTLEYNSSPVSVGQQIVTDPTNTLLLRYIPELDTHGHHYADFKYKIIDNCQQLPLMSDVADIEINVEHVNHPPEAGDFAIQMCPNKTFDFYQQLFIDEFSDQDGDSLAKIRFNTLPAAGQLLYNGTPIMTNQEFTTSQIDDITYESDSNDSMEYIFDYQASDGQAWSNVAQIAIQIKSDNDCYYNDNSQVIGSWES